MSAVEELTVVLQHDIDEQYQYQPGEIVRGKVAVKVARPTPLRSITIRVVGEGTVSWKEPGDGSICQAQETYIDASKMVLDTRHGDPLTLSPPGPHEFAFEYQIPDGLPSSYIGKYGNVTYTIRATLTGVKAADTAITSEPFLVLRRCPLPASVQEAKVLEQEKRVWGGCTCGKVSARLTLERQGGVPAEDVFMHAEIKNRSGRTITAMQASLIMVSVYHARSQTTSFRQVVSKKRDEFDVEYNEGRRWNYVRLTLPPYIPESRLDFCDIIEIDYVFQFRVEVSGGAELKMECPFLIGAHPQGLEIPRVSREVNNQWTIRASGLPMLPADDPASLHQQQQQQLPQQQQQQHVDLGDPHQEWGLVSGVPELRGDKVVVNNPLFRQGSFLTKAVKVVPDELMENTRL